MDGEKSRKRKLNFNLSHKARFNADSIGSEYYTIVVFLLLHFIWSAWALSNHVYLLNLLLPFHTNRKRKQWKRWFKKLRASHWQRYIIFHRKFLEKQNVICPYHGFLLNQIEMFCQKIRENPFMADIIQWQNRKFFNHFFLHLLISIEFDSASMNEPLQNSSFNNFFVKYMRSMLILIPLHLTIINFCLLSLILLLRCEHRRIAVEFDIIELMKVLFNIDLIWILLMALIPLCHIFFIIVSFFFLLFFFFFLCGSTVQHDKKSCNASIIILIFTALVSFPRENTEML